MAVVPFPQRKRPQQERPKYERRQPKRSLDWRRISSVARLMGLAIILTVALWVWREPLHAALSPACTIRANIDKRTGERIYHLPGQRYYAATRISPWQGERWFCSTIDAERAGWRRSRV